MSDHLPSLDASDSGFLNAFVGPHRLDPSQRGVASRVGGEAPASPAAESVDLDALLQNVRIPDGLHNRLNQIAAEE